MKLFCVEKWWRPEWGKSELLFKRYFTVNNRETLEAVVRARYGDFNRYNRYDRGEEVIEIEECQLPLP